MPTDDLKKQDQSSSPSPVQSQPTPRQAKRYRDNPDDPRNKPGYTPPSHAAAHLTRIHQKARQQEKDGANPGIPEAAKPVDPLSARYAPMPPGGLAALAEELFPDDFGNDEAMAGHIHDLLLMNRGTLRDDTSHPAGVHVRIA